MLESAEEGNQIVHNGIIIKRSSLEKARNLYELCIYEYLHLRLGDHKNPADASNATVSTKWHDLAGQTVSESTLQAAMKAESIKEIEEIFDKAHANYKADELSWIASNLKDWQNTDNLFSRKSAEFDAFVLADHDKSLNDISHEQSLLSFMN